MELTLDQALQKGIEAHKTGRAQEAARLYTAILTAQPKHPDANHNMGILAVGAGKVQEALPFFKTALEANPNTAQFWLSYIDALIKLERLADAKAMFDQAKSNGAKGDGFDVLAKRLAQTLQDAVSPSQNTLMESAIQLRDSGQFVKAIKLLKTGTIEFAQDTNTLALLSHCHILNNEIEEATLHLDKAKSIDPNNAAVGWNEVRLLLRNNNIPEALAKAKTTNKRFPDDVEGMGVLGSCLRVSNEIEESIIYLNKAIELNASYAEAFINRGLIKLGQEDNANALKDLETAHKLRPHVKQIWDLVVGLKMEFKEFSEAIVLLEGIINIDPDNEKFTASMALCHQHLGDFDSAIVLYKKSIAIKPDYAESWANLGSAFKVQGKLEEAMGAYNKALEIKPNCAEVYNNVGVILEEQGKLEETIEAYKKALAIKPNYAEAKDNALTLQTQLKGTALNTDVFSNRAYKNSNFTITQRPKHEIINAISSFLSADHKQAHKHMKNYNACSPKLIADQTPVNMLFCSAYGEYLNALLKEPFEKSPDIHTNNVIYHIGESHCLSYAHRNIRMRETTFAVTPMITFGAKAFHFTNNRHEQIKAITRTNFTSIPKASKVFISFGEIDCRPEEGFILAATKLNKPIDEVVVGTVTGYLKWLFEQNKTQNHCVYILNVPAPKYDIRYNAKINTNVANVVALFNTSIRKNISQYRFNLIDIFAFTVSHDGFSNNRFHIDGKHLGSKAIPEIEKQLNN